MPPEVYHVVVSFGAAEHGSRDDQRFETMWSPAGMFDYHFPFREVITRLVEVWAQDGNCEVEICAYQPYEDFIEFGLNWLGEDYLGYFEHSLGVLEFRSRSQRSLDILRARVNGLSLRLQPYRIPDMTDGGSLRDDR